MREIRYRPEILFYLILTGLIFVLLVRIFYLQIFQGAKYTRLARLNHVRVIPEQAARGKILDRFGQILAESQPVFSVFLYPTGQETEADLSRIAFILKMPVAEIFDRIKKNSSEVLAPVLLKDRLSFSEVMRLEEEKYRRPGLIIQKRALRFYPNDSALAHILGYVGLISEEELKKISPEKFYATNDFIGKDGVEVLFEELLKGKNGGQQIAVDAAGRLINILESIPPMAGDDINLTIDLDLQKKAEQALGPKRGAVVVLEARTGEVLAMVSHPTFNPNMFSQPISPGFWQFQERLGKPFFNRAINAYPPGSVFKMITAIAGLESGQLREQDTFYCPGFLKLGVRTAFCWEKKGHGLVDLMRAIVNSCDVAFYNIGLRLGLETITDWAKKFGFGTKTGLELPGEASGFLPSKQWKTERRREAWYPGDTINVAIGQGFIQATPLQVAVFMECLANDGIYYSPKIVRKSPGENEKKSGAQKEKILGEVEISSATLQFIKESMRQVVKVGTGQAAQMQDLEIAGKTGTAEDPPRYPAHAWFACFAPYQNPELAIAVFVEQGGHGGAVAAPIAKEIVQWWWEKKGQVQGQVL